MSFLEGSAEDREPAPPWLDQVLETVAEFEQASIELVGWELSLPLSSLRPAWRHAVRAGWLERVGVDPDSGELIYRIGAERGEHSAQAARPGDGGAAQS